MNLSLSFSCLRRVAIFALLVVPLGYTAAQDVAPAASITQARVVQAVDEKQVATLKGNVHPLARAEFDQGAVADSQPMNRMLLLLRRSAEQEAALRRLLDDQQSKASPNFHSWLTPEQFGAQFGIADSDLLAVTQWLTSQGFTNINVGPGRSVIEFSGNVGQVRNAFHAEIHRFHVGTEDHLANSTDPQIPAALTPVVAGVVSLHNFPRKSHAKILGRFRRTIGQLGITPLLTFPNPFSGSAFYGMGPGDFATIYNSKPLIAAGNDGTGQTIAIVGETNINVQDVQMFRSMFGLPANFDSSNIILNGEDPGITSIGEEGEADLDVEWSGATAPGATIKFVVSASTPASAGIDLSALYIIEHNLAGAMSESYGECESALGTTGNAFYNSLWEQAAAQGITVIVSSGDGGSAGCDNFNTQQTATHGLAVSGLASTPFNISLGGTDFDEVNRWTTFWNSSNDATGTSAKSYIPEIPWNENCAQISLTGCGASAPNGSLNLIAGSGGQSKIYSKPSWQVGVTGMPNDSHRDQPDVSLLGSPGFNGTGYVYCQSDSNISGGGVCDISNANNGFLEFGIIGGTSASAPAFAGVMALVNQKQATSSDPAPRQGNANHTLYALAKKSGASCVSSTTEAAGCIFNDVTKGNSVLPTGLPGVGTNSVPCKGGTLNCSAPTAGSNGVLVDPSHTTTEAWTVTPGYDMVTGLGTVNVNNLATNWGSASTIPTTTTLTLSPTTGITHGVLENVTVGVTVKATIGSGVPTGDVSLIASLAANTTQGVDEFPLVNGAVATAKTQNLPGGTYMVHAHYSGDGTNAPSDSPPVQVTVTSESSQTFIVIPTFDSTGHVTSGNATSLMYGSNYIIRMYVTDKNAVASTTGPPAPTCDTVDRLTCPTGTVSLASNGSPVDGNAGSFNLNSGGYTRDLVPTLTGGTYSLAANYGGDSSYQPSTSAPHSFSITPAPTTMSVPYIPTSPEIVGTPISVSSFLISNLQSGIAPTGTITFFDGTTAIPGTVTYISRPGQPGALDASISGSIMATFTSSGTHSITARYSGDASYAASTSFEWDAAVFYPTTTTITPSATTIQYGSSVTLTAKVASPYKTPAMVGQILFEVNGNFQPGTPAVLGTDASGNQTLTSTLTLTPQDTLGSVQASFGQDPNFQSSSGFTSVFVNIPDFSLSNSTLTPITAGQSQNFTVTVTPASTTPSTVTLGAASFVTLPPGMTVSFNPSTVNLNGAPVNVTATVTTTAASGGAGAQAQVQNVFPWVSFMKAILDTRVGLLLAMNALMLALFVAAARNRKRMGRAVFASLVFLMIVIPGCGGGSSGGGGITPPGPSIVTLTTTAAKVPSGGSITFNVSTSGTAPTGSVNIFQGPLGVGSGVAPPVTLVNGKAAVTVPFFNTAGTYPFWAQYLGDSRNVPSQSTTALQEVITGQTQIIYNAQTGGLNHQGNIQINLQ